MSKQYSQGFQVYPSPHPSQEVPLTQERDQEERNQVGLVVLEVLEVQVDPGKEELMLVKSCLI